MTQADRPASRRPPPNPHVRAAWLPSFTFDPIIYQAIMVCNAHWILIHFLLGVTWLDCDDDKLGHSMNKSLNHRRIISNTKKKDKNGDMRTVRIRCVLCCNRCDNHRSSRSAADPKHSRLGRETVQYCSVCGVHLCNHCFMTFHCDERPILPLCHPAHQNNSPFPARRLVLDGSPTGSPKRVTRTRKISNTASASTNSNSQGSGGRRRSRSQGVTPEEGSSASPKRRRRVVRVSNNTRSSNSTSTSTRRSTGRNNMAAN